MGRYVGQRLILSFPTIVGLTILLFLVLHVAIRTNAIDLMLAGVGQADASRAQQLKKEIGLDQPLPIQYLRWVGALLRGDLGTSLLTRRSVAQDLLYRLPTTLELGLGAIAFSVALAIPLGVLSAVCQDRWPDYVFRSLAILINAVPGFWSATLLLTLGSVWFSWAPPLQYRSLLADPAANLGIMVAPVILLGLAPVGAMIRLMRSQLLDVLREDYIRTARAKGLSGRNVYFRHALRNTLLPVVTLVASRVPVVLAGAVIFEQIFGLPGVGRYLLDAIGRLDYPVIQTVNLFFGLVVVLTNLAVDVSYAWIDPRIKY